MKNTTFIITTAILVAIIAFCIAGTVEGQEPGASAAEEAFYKEQEAQLLHTKACLKELGYINSGVTLNRIVDAEGKREYTFTIHHSRIDKMDAAGRKGLAQQLSDREVSILDADGAAKYVVHYEFLIL